MPRGMPVTGVPENVKTFLPPVMDGRGVATGVPVSDPMSNVSSHRRVRR